MKKAWVGVEKWLGIQRKRMFNDLFKSVSVPEVKADLVTTIVCDDPNEEPTISEAERFRRIAGEDALSDEEIQRRHLFNE